MDMSGTVDATTAVPTPTRATLIAGVGALVVNVKSPADWPAVTGEKTRFIEQDCPASNANGTA
jgi:hypothetical protein